MQYPQLLDYISEHSSPQPAYLDQIVHRTGLYTINPRMLSGHVQGRFLSFLSRLIRPVRILELGTFAGFSALCLAEGLQPGGKVVTIEKNDELEDFIRENLALSPLGEQVELHIGSTRDVLPTLPTEELFDLVFIDADKREYVHDYELLFPLVKSGGIILADNTLWDGHIIDPAYDTDKQTIALRAFNDHIRCDSRVSCLILPVRDGLTIITKH
ncbi:MAG: O-methyltransferase [Bacteroidales bacterium]|nr:O-methyltransferase [Bacteroidales bacterium]